MSIAAYRPDIDGLRAVAALSVVLHHLGVSILPGGFVGVDIFFVISGYLITSQIFAQLLEQRFSLRQFYKRRINRILPALLTVMAATLAVAPLLLAPADLMRLLTSALYATVGLSNIFFWSEYGNYFSTTTGEAPLLHTWSLGVEEQFYVIWPLLLMLLHKIGTRSMIIAFVVLTGLAIAVSHIGTGIVASASYYLLPTRFFELMIGGLLAFPRSGSLPLRNASEGASILGVALIVAPLTLLDKASMFPGLNALYPCLGSALLIWSGGQPTRINTLLASRPLVFVGLISYPLYLWHWPIIAYLNYAQIPVDLLIGSLVLAASIGLAWASWMYVEIPMRKSGNAAGFTGVLAQRFLIPVGVLSLLLATTLAFRGFPGRFDPKVADFEKMVATQPQVLRRGCHVPTAFYASLPKDTCRLGLNKPKPDGILIGDSYANHFTGMLDVMAKAARLSIIDYTMNGCPPILGYDTGRAAGNYVESCRKRNAAAYSHIVETKYKKVLLAASWPSKPEAAERIAFSIDELLKTGAQLTVILSNAAIPNGGSCTIRHTMYGTDGACSSAQRERPIYWSVLQAKYPQVRFVDPNAIICRKERCEPVLDGTLLYRDSGHLNDQGSRLIGNRLLQAGVTL